MKCKRQKYKKLISKSPTQIGFEGVGNSEPKLFTGTPSPAIRKPQIYNNIALPVLIQ